MCFSAFYWALESAKQALSMPLVLCNVRRREAFEAKRCKKWIWSRSRQGFLKNSLLLWATREACGGEMAFNSPKRNESLYIHELYIMHCSIQAEIELLTQAWTVQFFKCESSESLVQTPLSHQVEVARKFMMVAWPLLVDSQSECNCGQWNTLKKNKKHTIKSIPMCRAPGPFVEALRRSSGSPQTAPYCRRSSEEIWLASAASRSRGVAVRWSVALGFFVRFGARLGDISVECRVKLIARCLVKWKHERRLWWLRYVCWRNSFFRLMCGGNLV